MAIETAVIYSGVMFAIEEGVGRARRHMTEGGNKEFSINYTTYKIEK